MEKVLGKNKIDVAATAVDTLLSDLNREQRKAVTHENGPLLIVAGAGTGKTSVITKRIAWLILSGRAEPDEILALTFTDKAAGEMIERVDTLLPLGYTDLWISTFHSFCQRLLNPHGLDIGLPNDIRILNETDAYLMVRKNFDRFNLDYYRPLGNPTKFIHAMLKHFSRAKDEAVEPKEYLEYVKNIALDKDNPAHDAEDASRQQELANAYHTYERLLHENGCIDLGGLLLYTLRLFRERPRILDKYRRQFKYILVDEFQDTNWAQYELLKMLAPSAANIVVVGDDDQSIYKFRGASVSNILQFKNDYPDSREVVLTMNYRSRQKILDIAYNFIQLNNPNRLEAKLAAGSGGGSILSKRLIAHRPDAAEIEHLHFASLEDEAAGVLNRILDIKEKGTELTWSDFCVLVRSNAGAEEFSREFQRRGIPYQFLALKGLYSKPIILDILAYFKLLDNYHESPALYRTFSSPPFRIAGEDLIALTHEARKKALSLYEVIKHHAANQRLKPETHAVLEKLLGLLEKHTGLARSKSVSELLITFLHDSGYVAEFKNEDTTEAKERVSFLKQFMNRVKRFEAGHDDPSLRHFMEEFALERDSGEEGSLAFDIETGPDMVRIMTVHAAKGLEFSHVFVAGLVDKRFPSVERGGEIELPDPLVREIIPEGDIHLEEERRLFYVAMTRARDGLFFTSAEDYGGKTKKKLSRFLTELGFEKSGTLLSISPLLHLSAARRAPSAAHPHILPSYFSFTQLAAYSKCPLQYKFAHVLKIPVFGKPQFSFGKTIHAVLERFLRELTDRKIISQQSLFGVPSGSSSSGGLPVGRDELMKMYDELWEDDWYPDRPTKEKYRERGRAILNLFYDSALAEPPKPLYLEKDFKLKFGAYLIKGKIDRIEDAGEGLVEIIDYKTGASKGAESLRSEDKQQLILYQIAVSRLFGLKPVKLTYNYLEDGARVSFLGKEEELAKFEQEVAEQIKRIKSRDFAPNPGRHCGFCDFASICEFRAK